MTLDEHTKEGTALAIQGAIFGVTIGGAAILACFDSIPWIAGLFGFASGLFFGLGLMAWAKARAWKRAFALEAEGNDQ
jgi:hypothetical protein